MLYGIKSDLLLKQRKGKNKMKKMVLIGLLCFMSAALSFAGHPPARHHGSAVAASKHSTGKKNSAPAPKARASHQKTAVASKSSAKSTKAKSGTAKPMPSTAKNGKMGKGHGKLAKPGSSPSKHGSPVIASKHKAGPPHQGKTAVSKSSAKSTKINVVPVNSKRGNTIVAD